MTLPRLVATNVMNLKSVAATFGLAHYSDKLPLRSWPVAKQETDRLDPTPMVIKPPDTAKTAIIELFDFGFCTHADNVGGIAARINQLMVNE